MSKDSETIERLLAGDEQAFTTLVSAYHGVMLHVAMSYCSTRDVAEEVVQETWMAVLKGLARFEGRSSLKTWIFRILVNRSKTRATREGRTLPASALASGDDEPPDLDPARFTPDGHWSTSPQPWTATPEKLALDQEVQRAIHAAIAELPQRQQIVITMRDVQGLSSEEVCSVLEVSETNQRVLLHRARSKVRATLDSYLEGRR